MSIPQIHQLGEVHDTNTNNWKLCIICQSDDESKGQLVQRPQIDSYHKLLSAVCERADLNDGQYVQIQHRLKDVTTDTMCEESSFWHRKCYLGATNKDHIQRARDRHEHAISTGEYTRPNRGRKRGSAEVDHDEAGFSGNSAPFLRSSTTPLNKDYCFFCQENTDEQVFKVCSDNAGKSLKAAIDKGHNPILKTRLSTCISPSDAHAIDVRYHKSCWTTHVFHVLRESDQEARSLNARTIQNSCLIELINLVDIQTQNKAYLSMDSIEATYKNMLGPDGLENHYPQFNRQWLKEKILTELPSVKSVLQKNRRKPAVLYSPDACEKEMVESAISRDANDMLDMKAIFKAAQIVRRCIVDFRTETSPNIEVSSNMGHIPSELYTMIRWILVGTVNELATGTRSRVVDWMALTVSQNIMYGFKTNRQVNYCPQTDTNFRQQRTRENPQVRGLALTVHHDTRNKTLMELLNAHGYCISYEQTLRIETALANAVVENTKEFQGLYVPPFLKKGSFVFFAADNSDFSEDTPDGKGTTHGTIVTIYQKAAAQGEPVAPPLKIDEANSLAVLPYHVHMMQCNKPKPKVTRRDRPFEISRDGINKSTQMSQLGWILATVISRLKAEEKSSLVPCWAGYNSLLSSSLPITQIGALPLLPEVAHEWSTLLTVLMQASQLRYLAVGENHPTVISFDMALYEKIIQLLDARPDLKRTVVPRLGELHAVMAALRALGSSIENSGIDDAWIEADVYGTATTRQILKCSNYKRCLRAHIYSYVALYELVLEEFFKDKPEIKDACWKAIGPIELAFSKGDSSRMAATIKEVNAAFLDAMASDAVLETFEEWKKQKAHNAMFKSIMNYLHRVETILFFIASSRNADLSLHLQAADSLSKLFFAFDRIKYKRLWPRYIADMHDLKTTHPETWKELEAGNLSVTRKSIPFVSIGADHACEHVNKQMKVHSGLIGISNNANARQRFFLATPVLSCMSREYKNQFLTSSAISNGGDHHELGSSKIKRDHAAIDKIKSAILSHGNPITSEGDKLYNIITHAYVPQEHVQKILDIDGTGQALYENYVEERINGETSLWTPVKKEKFAMFKSGNQKASVKTRNKTVDLKETKDLYGRLLVISRSERQVDQKEAVANYEFTLTPRALFAPNGDILPCCDKSKMINLLQKLPEKTNTQRNQPKSADDELEHPAIQDRAETRSEFLVDVADLENLDTGNDLPPNTVNDDQYDSQDDLQTTNASHQNESQDDNNSLQASMENESPMDTEPTKSINQDDSPSRKIALVDGMVVVQKLTKKPSSVVTIKDLGRWFYDRLISMTRDYDEIILVFDTYKENSLKDATREKRRHNKAPVQYNIRDDTMIRNIPMSRLLSHDQTKADLTAYLAAATLEYSKNSPKLFITSAAGDTMSNSQLSHLDFEKNNHEEADTLLIHQAVLASQRNPTDATIMVFSPDTDVFVLMIAYYEMLLKDTRISLVSGVVDIGPIWTSLGRDRARALPAFHAFTGADTTGRFSKIGKGTWLKCFLKADPTVVAALEMLSQVCDITDDLVTTLAHFVCSTYSPRGVGINNIPELRWYLFCKHMAESEKLPPTLGALKQHALRAHVQARVWGQAHIAHQIFLDPLKNGYHKNELGHLKPTTTESPPAPEGIIELVRCKCKTDCSSARCTCRSKDLPCTELCMCISDCQNNEDVQDVACSSLSDDDSGDDEELY